MGDDLNKRIAEAQAKLKAKERPARPSGDGMGLGLRMATDFVAAVIVGLVLGWGVDAVFRVSPWGLVVCVMLGVVTGMWNVVRQANAAQKQAQQHVGNQAVSGQADGDNAAPAAASKEDRREEDDA